MAEFLDVDPRTLRLPLTRPFGADPFKLARQYAHHGDSVTGMPIVEATRCAGGDLGIANGVTRATRFAQLFPGQPIRVEVIEERPTRDISSSPLLGDNIR